MPKKYSKFNLFIRSAIFFVVSLTTMIIYSLLVVFSIFMPLKTRHALIRVYLRFYMWLLASICHINYQIEGLENIPKEKPGIILSKHQSVWETFFLPLIFHEPAIIAKRELLWLPFFGWGLAAADPIAINRKDKKSSMEQIISKGKKCLEGGRSILIFPEGTRIPYGQIGHSRLGGARLSAATGFPIIPVAHDAGRLWPKRSFIKYPGTIRVVIGPPIEALNRTPQVLLQLSQDWIEGSVQRIRGLVDESTS